MTFYFFRIKFFQSHYFHRDRLLHSSKSGGNKDIFTECAKDDDNTIKAQIREGVTDPLANLDGFNDKTLDDCFSVAESVGDTGKMVQGSNVVHQNIIKRINQVTICASDSTIFGIVDVLSIFERGVSGFPNNYLFQEKDC